MLTIDCEKTYHIPKLRSYSIRTGFCSVTFSWQLTEEQGPYRLHVPSKDMRVLGLTGTG